MNHSRNELFEIVYHYYARGMPREHPRWRQTDEYGRLSAARRQAGADNEPWRVLLWRMRVQFPDCRPSDGSLHLPTGDHDAGYCGELMLPNAPGERPRTIGFMVSFLVPYYIVYSTRTVDDTERRPLSETTRYQNVFIGDTMYVVPSVVARFAHGVARLGRLLRRKSALQSEGKVEKESYGATRRDIHFDLSPEEQPYAAWIAREIEATWGGARMPPEVGNVIVPDVATSNRQLGEARLYDCLFGDSW